MKNLALAALVAALLIGGASMAVQSVAAVKSAVSIHNAKGL